ncbi:hypothetical protein CHISP_3397 [Chitinispirillum alkaliphilum]|nr:hypothetical protein CHISP_3397 [Chitinispirillum alkaliphilum]
MKRFLLITALIIATLITALMGTFFLAIRSNTVHQYVISRVNQTIPGSLKFDRIHISPLRIQLEINDFSLSDPSGKELAGFDRFFIDVSPIALIRRKLVIKSAVLEYPWASVEIDSSGNVSILSAFPQGQPEPEDTISASKSSSELFPVVLQGLDIVGGKIHFASQPDSISIEAFGLALTAAGETDSLRADLTLGFDSLALEHSGTNLRLHQFQLAAKMRDLDIDSLDLRFKTGKSVFALNGSASSLLDGDPLLDLAFNGDISLEEVTQIAALEEELSGNAKLRLDISGKASNPDVNINVAYDGGDIWGYPVNSLRFDANLADRDLRVTPFYVDADLGSVDIAGNINIKEVFEDGFLSQMGSLNKTRYNLSISANKVLIQNFAPELSGTADAVVKVDGRGTDLDSIIANSTVTANISSLKLNPESQPLDMEISTTASVKQGFARISQLGAKLGDTDLSLTGGYQISSGNMEADLDLFAPSLQPLLRFAGIDETISGSAAVNANIKGDLKNPKVAMSLSADTISSTDIHLDSVRVSAQLEKDGTAHLKSLTINRLNSGISLSGSTLLLRNGTLVPVDEMVFELALLSEDLHIEDFIESVSGAAHIEANISGTVNDPQGYVRASAEKISAAEQSITGVDLFTRFENRRANIESLQIAILPDQKFSVAGWVSLENTFDINLSALDLDLNKLTALADIDSIYGALSLDLWAGGNFSQPEADGTLYLRDLRMGTFTLDDIALHLGLKDQQAQIKGNAMGDLNASYNIDTKYFSADLAIDNMQLDPYLALSGQNLNGMITAALKASGNTDSLPQMEAALHISALTIGFDGIQLLQTDDLKVSLQNNRYFVPDFSLTLAGEGAFSGKAQGYIEGPHDVTLNGTIPLSFAHHFTEDFQDIDGSIDLDLSFSGMADAPDLNSEVRLTNLSMTLPELHQQLHSVNGHIVADNNSVRLQSLRGNLDNGSFNIRGDVKLDDFTPSDLRAQIVLRSLPLSVPDMLDLVVDARLNVAGNPDTTRVSGDIVLLDGVYFQDIVINPLQNVGQRRRQEIHTPEETEVPYLKNMRFDVGVQARSPFRVNNNLARLTISPDLHLSGTFSAPALNGRANVQQGTINYLRNEFEIRRGVIDFINPYAIEPEVDIQGVVPVNDRIVQLEVSGTLDNLVFKLSSNDPDLEDQDILSLLVLGKTIGELQDNFQPGAPGTGQTNQQMLAALIASTFGDDIRRATGLDILEVETGDEFDDDSDRIAVTMGKQFTRQLSTRYTVESKDGEIVQRAVAEYRILQNLLIGAFQDTRGVYGGELRFIWEGR